MMHAMAAGCCCSTRNEGDGHFREVHEQVADLPITGWALSIGAGDLNNDGWPDIYVANDFGAATCI